MDLESVFTAKPKSFFETVNDAGLCFYLPAYQRPYSWNKQNIKRVFDDVVSGLSNLTRNEDAITFIGTILTIHDTKYRTIKPFLRGEVPSRVMLVIDGQQRLTTLLLIASVLYERLYDFSIKIQKILEKQYKNLNKTTLTKAEVQSIKDDVTFYEWFQEKIEQELASLRIFSTDTNSPRDKVYRWYPKIIRAYIDCWSKKKESAIYESPIARYLHRFNEHLILCEGENKYIKFKYDIHDKHSEYEKHKVVVQNLKEINKLITAIYKQSYDEEFDQPSIKELCFGSFNSTFQMNIPEDIEIHLEKNKQFSGVFNLIAFSKYFLNRVCVTFVTVTDEAYAFDMFEALNTTGEPLTSFETFKPKVVEEEGLDKYESSPSKKYIDEIESYFERFGKAEEKHSATSRILLSFSLAETGDKITKHISDQRRYLLTTYKDAANIEEKREIVKNLALICKFYQNEWDSDQPEYITDSESEENLPRLCIEVLKEAKHEIVIPLITRAYYRYLNDENFSDDTLYELVKAITAFFVFWRSSHKSTSGIDSVYREIMKIGLEEYNVLPMARKYNHSFDIESIKKYFRTKLTEKITGTNIDGLMSCKNEWIRKASVTPVYKISKPLTKLLLLAAIDDTTEDPDCNGLSIPAKKGKLKTLSWFKWHAFNNEINSKKFSIEHVAPQSRNNWTINFDDSDIIHSLGNLTILPISANSSISDASWNEKRACYSALCQDTTNEAYDAFANATCELSESIKATMAEQEYLGYLNQICQAEEWNEEFIRKRSERMYDHIWNKLIGWLT